MKNKCLLILIGLFAICLASCRSLLIGLVKDRALKSAIRITDTVRNRQVILLSMMHMGTKEHYDELRQYILQRKAEGFITFYEGVAQWSTKIDGPYDSLKVDTLQRKVRRIIGFALGDYDDKSNRSMPAYIRNSNLVAQNYDSIGITNDGRDYWVDLTYSQVVRFYEARNDTIPLIDYDFQTPLNAPYKMPNNGYVNKDDFIGKSREQRVTDEVLISKHPKILIVYGGAHSTPISIILDRSGYEKFEYRFLEKEARAARNAQKTQHKTKK